LIGDVLCLLVSIAAIVAAALSYKFMDFPANQQVRRNVSPRKPGIFIRG
jgi:peptidoglycan/LPS O-acetylase OafA/YrhL